MGWSFAIINGKLAEIFFDTERGGDPVMRGHCYVEKSEYKTKREQHWIESDTKEYRFTYRNKKYYDQIGKKVLKPQPYPRDEKSVPLKQVLAKLDKKRGI